MSIAYNEYVKKPYEEYNYTVEEAKELLDCSECFWSFLKHIKIIHPDEGRIPFKPYEYQKDIFDLILNNRFVIAMVARQSGKCVHPETIIKLRNKKTKEVIEIEIGKFYEELDNKMK